jgi:hypothetical protein
MGAWLTRKLCRRTRDIIRKGTGAAAREVLFILLEVRIRVQGMPAEKPDVFVPEYAQVEHILE